MKKLNLYLLVLTLIISSCGPSSQEKKILDDEEQLQKDIAMYKETWSLFLAGDPSVINSERFHEDVVIVTPQGDLVGLEACKNFYMNYVTGFSDLEFKILEVLGQGNRLVKHWNFKGTHTGPAFGLPATGNKLDLSGTTLVTMKDGRIAKEQDFFDVTQMLNKLTTGDVNADASNPGVL
tara:strand:+ start:15781 stop:16317 length:537 start_codon:yes stop_codon:yes gene_type:complete